MGFAIQRKIPTAYCGHLAYLTISPHLICAYTHLHPIPLPTKFTILHSALIDHLTPHPINHSYPSTREQAVFPDFDIPKGAHVAWRRLGSFRHERDVFPLLKKIPPSTREVDLFTTPYCLSHGRISVNSRHPLLKDSHQGDRYPLNAHPPTYISRPHHFHPPNPPTSQRPESNNRKTRKTPTSYTSEPDVSNA